MSRIATGSYTFQSGLSCAEWLLHSPSPPTAIFASNDQMAFGTMVAAQKMGINVPSDLTVVGFDDSPRAEEVWPALTTVNQDIRKLGQLATEKIVALCSTEKNKATAIRTEIKPEFVQRQSTAPPRQSD